MKHFWVVLCIGVITLLSSVFIFTSWCSGKNKTIDFDIPLLLKNVPEQILYRKNYIVSYNKETKIPNWVAWRLKKKHLDGQIKRPGNAWHEDLAVPKPRATNNDYRNSGWSRGHLCPAGDNKWDSVAMYESFLFTNCCPQNAKLNSGDWNEIEMLCRRWTMKFDSVDIVCGPILFQQEHLTIGENKIIVPEAFFKVVICLDDKPKGISFICRNSDGNRPKDFYINTISETECITGITFFPHLSAELSEKVKQTANLNDWK
ncbi:MAG: DNA/RNA non-specific endonuclease [Bacteroidales bacterium]|nr:DNA/RNA non-specific endonuclease [Bacteroidales bacterium]